MSAASQFTWEYLVEPELQERAIDVFITHCNSPKGLTCHQAAARMKVQVNCISGRYKNLCPDYLIITGWQTRKNKRNRSIYTLTERGKKLKKALQQLKLL